MFPCIGVLLDMKNYFKGLIHGKKGLEKLLVSLKAPSYSWLLYTAPGKGNDMTAVISLLVLQMNCDTRWQRYLQHWSNHTYHQDNSKVVQHDRSACPSDRGNHMSSRRSSRSTLLVLAHRILNKKPQNAILILHFHNSNTCDGFIGPSYSWASRVSLTHSLILSLTPWLSCPLRALAPLNHRCPRFPISCLLLPFLNLHLPKILLHIFHPSQSKSSLSSTSIQVTLQYFCNCPSLVHSYYMSSPFQNLPLYLYPYTATSMHQKCTAIYFFLPTSMTTLLGDTAEDKSSPFALKTTLSSWTNATNPSLSESGPALQST